MSTLRIVGPGSFSGRVTVPGDKSISHRALLLSAAATGRSTIRGLSDGDDVRRTLQAVERLGAATSESADGVVVDGGGLHSTDGVIDLGNSGTGIRLLAGLVAGLDLDVVLDGDRSIRQRPMARIAEPLRRMGARISGRDGHDLAPLHIVGGGLNGIDYEVPVPSAQVKSAVLLAGLHADGPTIVRERAITRTHTEEMLREFGADVTVEPDGIRLLPSALTPSDVDVPGDPSQAAFWAVGGVVTPGSELEVAPLYRGPARGGYEEVMRRMGAAIEITPSDGLQVASAPLEATVVASHEVPGLIDEIPVLAIAASAATGTTRFEGVGELRLKETDRLDAIITELGAIGVLATADGDDLSIDGPVALHPGSVDSRGDHRIAMSAAIAAVGVDGETTVEGWEAVATSYPTFVDHLRACTEGVTIEVER